MLKTIRTLAALTVTLPLYLVSCGLPSHPFTAEWEKVAKSLVAR